MIAYVDTSVLLRVAFNEPSPLEAWRRLDRPISSELTRVEALRAVDRARFLRNVDESTIAERRAGLLALLDGMELVGLDRGILERASLPFPTSVATLDALHLATAVALREEVDGLAFATHDRSLGIAAHALGFSVEGVSVSG
ncbi:MAG TPA: type II toxin-antitoxin system VapC family toxin [Candidatus Limnocylindria bacterium]|nr:type II toxin-antitoxin system VapC family toxin [Candidatus Limnocylindria bacterium]